MHRRFDILHHTAASYCISCILKPTKRSKSIPLEKYKRNIILQGNTEYCLLHVHVKYLTERRKNNLGI